MDPFPVKNGAGHLYGDVHNAYWTHWTRLTGLADKEGDIVPEDGGATVQEVGGQLHHYWQLCQLLHQLTRLEGGQRE